MDEMHVPCDECPDDEPCEDCLEAQRLRGVETPLPAYRSKRSYSPERRMADNTSAAF